MVRVLDLSSPRFRRALAAFSPRGTAEYKALFDVLRELSAAHELPGPDDVAVALPMSVMSRPIPGTHVAVVYVAGPDVLHVVALIQR